MEVVFVTAVLSICLFCATAAPPARLPWEKLSAASQSVYRNTDDILRFEPVTSIDSVWEAFKAKHGMTLVHVPNVSVECVCSKVMIAHSSAFLTAANPVHLWGFTCDKGEHSQLAFWLVTPDASIINWSSFVSLCVPMDRCVRVTALSWRTNWNCCLAAGEYLVTSHLTRWSAFSSFQAYDCLSACNCAEFHWTHHLATKQPGP